MSERVVGTPYVHIRHVQGDGGYQYTTRPATPAEIGAAHPKCETCNRYGWLTQGNDPTPIEFVCDDAVMEILNPATNYCDHHTALTEGER